MTLFTSGRSSLKRFKFSSHLLHPWTSQKFSLFLTSSEAEEEEPSPIQERHTRHFYHLVKGRSVASLFLLQYVTMLVCCPWNIKSTSILWIHLEDHNYSCDIQILPTFQLNCLYLIAFRIATMLYVSFTKTELATGVYGF